MIYVDLDDFCERNDKLSLLRQLRTEIPQFVVTLFVIPRYNSSGFLEMVRNCYPWIDLVPHGWDHNTSRECQDWTYDQCVKYLDRVEKMGIFTRGFKAPGWQISDGMYRALLERDYWVADQPYNDQRRPPELPVYRLTGVSNQIHGHVGHWGGPNLNELELIIPIIHQFNREEFGFIRDATILYR